MERTNFFKGVIINIIFVTILGAFIGSFITWWMTWIIGIIFLFIGYKTFNQSLIKKQTNTFVLWSMFGKLQVNSDNDLGLSDISLPHYIPWKFTEEKSERAVHVYTKENLVFDAGEFPVTYKPDKSEESEYDMILSILITLQINKPVKFYKKTGMLSLEHSHILSKNDPWLNDIQTDVKSTFEALGSAIKYEEWKKKTDWTIANIDKKYVHIHGTQDTLKKTIKSYGLNVLVIKVTAKINPTIKKAREEKIENIAKVEAMKILQEGKDKIIINHLKTLGITDYQSQEAKEAVQNKMIMMDEYKDERFVKISGVSGDANILEAIIAMLSKK